jgi:ankyrin repeat protein
MSKKRNNLFGNPNSSLFGTKPHQNNPFANNKTNSTTWNILFEYISSNDIDSLKRHFSGMTFLDRVSAVKISDQYLDTLLHVSVKLQIYDVIRYLLAIGIDCDTVNRYNETALDIAIKNHDRKAIQIFLDYAQQQKIEVIQDLERHNAQLKTQHDYISKEKTTLVAELEIVKADRKRLRDDNDRLETSNKKLKKDILSYQDMLKNNK